MSLGMGLLFVPLSATALSGVANHDAGVASAMVNTTQQVGGSLGTALLNTIFTTVVASFAVAHGTSAAQQVAGAIHGYNVAFTVSAVLLALAAVLAFSFIRRPVGGEVATRTRRRTRNASRRPSRADVVSTAWSAPKSRCRPRIYVCLSLPASNRGLRHLGSGTWDRA